GGEGWGGGGGGRGGGGEGERGMGGTGHAAGGGQKPPSPPGGGGISQTAAIAIAVLWTKSSGRTTGPSRRCAPGSNIRSGSSNGCSAFVKVRYRGLAKNGHRLVVTCALANLFMARRHLLRCDVA